MRSKVFRSLTWGGIAITLGLIFQQYLRPEFLLEMASQAVMCT